MMQERLDGPLPHGLLSEAYSRLLNTVLESMQSTIGSKEWTGVDRLTPVLDILVNGGKERTLTQSPGFLTFTTPDVTSVS